MGKRNETNEIDCSTQSKNIKIFENETKQNMKASFFFFGFNIPQNCKKKKKLWIQ